MPRAHAGRLMWRGQTTDTPANGYRDSKVRYFGYRRVGDDDDREVPLML